MPIPARLTYLTALRVAIGLYEESINQERWTVSIQIANPGGRAERTEVIGRLKGMTDATVAAVLARDGTDEDKARTLDEWVASTQAFVFALLGSFPTRGEMLEIIGE